MKPLKLLVLDVRNSRILSFDADGTLLGTILQGCGAPDGIAVDEARGHIYWTNMGSHHVGEDFMERDGTIERCDLDGGNRAVIVPAGTIYTPKQLQLDLVHDRIYWCDREGMRVQCCDLDGKNLTTLVQTGEGDADRQDRTRHCVGIAIDVPGQRLYWGQKGPAKGGVGRIFRAGLALPAGADPDQRPDVELLFDHLPEPIDLHLTSAADWLYWTDRGAPPLGNSLNRAALHAPQVTPQVLVTGLHEAIGLTADEAQNYVYFTDLGGHLYRARPDGQEFVTLHTGDGMFTGMTCLRA